MENKALAVLISGQHAGMLYQAYDGALSFSYQMGYEGVPLSLSMPIEDRVFNDKSIRPFLLGLLPDSYDVRKSLGLEYGVSPENPFDLLSHIGLDCPGAVQFCAEDKIEAVVERPEVLSFASDGDIAERLKKGRGDRSARWETDNEHWSLGGQQTKFALRQENGKWYSCKGAAATTHIFKPGIVGLKLSALNEYICLKLARLCGLPACEVDYLRFEGEVAVVATRYDRLRDEEGRVHRLHQEDFCQILGIHPDQKYSEQGGPNSHDVVAVCRRTGVPAENNIARYMDMLFFNYLIGAPDAHAKNYSLLLGQKDAYLAPLYDVASLLPYAERPFDIKLAQGIAGENRVGRLSGRRLEKFAEANGLEEYGLTDSSLAKRLESLAKTIPVQLDKVLSDQGELPDIDELGSRLLPLVQQLCERSIARLG